MPPPAAGWPLLTSMQTSRPWQSYSQQALDAHALRTPRPRLLRPRPRRWGDSEPNFVADLGHLELTEDVPYGNQQPVELEAQVTRCLLQEAAGV